MDQFCFFPSASQARLLDQRMRLSLADSLDHIIERAEGKLPFDFSSLAPMITRTRAGERYPPSTFSIYADIVLALCNEKPEAAVSLLEELALEQPLGQSWRALPLDAPEHSKQMPRYLRAMNSDPAIQFYMGPPSLEVSDRFAQRVTAGYRLMESAVPELAAEFNALVSDIIMVVGDDKAKYQFDGGSSYFLWGALFLNATSHETEVAMVEVMAHESAHILLYACASDEALVTNPDEELFASPLRTDLRPMDGIYHATFVSARMHWAMDQLIQSGRLDEAGRSAAEKARDEDAKNFWAGYEVVARHGQLTATGSRVMLAALEYMQSVTGRVPDQLAGV